ncbi:destruxin synthetase [Fusarium austroafricanum]|uniref:Destruxin synthetase n=1 Tax=Fusarium austroafricanum TaxID=2364996 RepID=A0A8H4JYK4_9HYPO|nr:destruxin synthetase [Fusarium austroafricanum]
MGSLGTNQSTIHWQAVLKGDGEPHSASSLAQTAPDLAVEHEFRPLRGHVSDSLLSSLIISAWGLVVNRQLASDDAVVFDAALPSGTDAGMVVVSLSLDTAGEKAISEYLLDVGRRLATNGPNGATTSMLKALLVIQSSENTSKQLSAVQMQDFSTRYPFIIDLHLSTQGIHGKASFSSSLFQTSLAQGLLERLEHTMHWLADANAERKLAEVEMVTPQDLNMIWRWNHHVPEQINRCVHDIFTDIAVSQPDAQAVCSWDGSLTYGELDRLSTALAGKLSSLGVQVDTIVPLCFHKSMWTIVALLGVLKAGGAFLLLDPSLPEKRLQYMTQTVNPRLILASKSNQDLSSRLAETVFVLEPEALEGDAQDSSWQPAQQSPASLMYVIFTSGSTGVPKCAMISHANAASAFHHQSDVLRFDSKSRILDFSSYSFTTTISNVFGALLLGGCLCVPSEDDRRNRLAEVIRSLEVNIVDLTPSVMQFLDPDQVPDLQVIIFGGEAISTREIARWWDKVHTVHLYGQSECTSNAVINGSPISMDDVLRIGKGSGLNTWIVDPEDHNKLQPVGYIGELFLEGPLVGCGYMNQPEETTAAFIEDPDWLLKGAPGGPASHFPGRHGRLYKTGDLVQYSDDGSLRFFGRKDAQVKIRGQRVELGEVEHWVKKFSGSNRAVAEVITPRGTGASPTLVAFLEKEAADGAEPVASRLPADLEAKLTQHLPVYMIPATLFTMRSIPTTATGKVNRKELRQIAASMSAEQLAKLRTSTGPKRQPVSHLQQTIHLLWSHVLKIEPDHIGLDDSFFHLGGDSVAAIKLVSEARKVRIKLEVADIIRHPILHDLVDTSVHELDPVQTSIPPFALLKDAVDVRSFLDEVASRHDIDPAKVQDAYPCTPLQEGLISLASARPGACVEQSVLELAPHISENDIHAAWSKIVRTMPLLRTRFVHHDTVGIVQIVLDEEIHWGTFTGLSEYLEADRENIMDLGQPFTRFAFVKENAGTSRWLVWTAHHALYDGWSIGLIKEAVLDAFRGVPIESGPQFQCFIQHIRQQDPQKVSGYWRRVLYGCDSVPFPTLPPSIDQPLADAVVQHDFAQSKRLSNDITTTALIHAAWALIIGRINASDEAVFGVTTSGRNAPVDRVEAMVAPTFATIPLRVNLSRVQKVSDYLNTIHQHSADVVAFEQAGLHKIARMSSGCQNACMFQSLLVIQQDRSRNTGHDDALGVWKTLSQHRWLNTYALMLEIRIGVKDIHISASFDQRVIESHMVRGLLNRLEYAMQQLDNAYDSTMTLEQVKITTPSDLDLLWTWNSQYPAPFEQCAHELIRQHVIVQPNAPAICAWDGELTYKELDQLTTNIGRYLVDCGIHANTLIPLCFEKSMWTAVAMLSVLKAGAGFALLEPSLPEERLRTIVDQLDTDMIISSSSNAVLSSRLCKTVVEISSDLAASLDSGSGAEMSSQLPSNVMFAVFTSGTTGKPKCVVLTHSNFCSGLKYQCELLGFHDKARIFDFAAYSFDIAVHNVFATLASGGCLCVPADKDRWGNLTKAIADMGATVADLTPSVARLIDAVGVPCLETLILAGEAVTIDDVTRWWGRVRVVNAYGPAECQISTINADASTPEETTRIGKGVGLLTWVVDQHDHNTLVPPGYIGELLLEGPLVSRGYLGSPQETVAKFIQDPTWLLHGNNGQAGRRGRMYKTGDLVRYNNDGSLSFVGRKDTQVKIHGQRVELGEIELYVQGCMAEMTTVIAEIIIPRGEAPSPMLVIFLEATEGMASNEDTSSPAASIHPIPSDIDLKLSKRLPRHMRPSALIYMPKLPTTSTGKTDRRQLQSIGAIFSVQDLVRKQTPGRNSKRQPTSDAERKMQGIWANVLGVKPEMIGLDDNFFQLGGDSIAALKVVRKAREVGIKMTVMDIFKQPTLSTRLSIGST